ncbi:hypothetical protein [Streptomyces sp. NPDC005438]|uniref:hypothetical protein n=1 Tax=Streptomyces sp. NPDC005438 TaxID=3156880 RepID=UPI0033B0AF98
MNGSDLLRYARCHRAVAVLSATATVALLSTLFGGTTIAVPSLGSGGVTTGVPYRHQLPLLSAVFLTATLDGTMSAHDRMAAFTPHRFGRVYRAGLLLTVAAFSFAAEALSGGLEAGTLFVRSLLIWLGLALLSARLLGHQLAWVIPLTSGFFLVWYPGNRLDWTDNPPTDPLSWALTATSLLAGTAALAATPWRLKALRHR